MSQLDGFTDSTLEIYNIERNILMGMLKRQGISVSFEELREMARKERDQTCFDHKGDFEPQRPVVIPYDE